MVNQVRTKDIKVTIKGQDLLSAELKKIRKESLLTFRGMAREATKADASIKKIRTQIAGTTNNLKTTRAQAVTTFRSVQKEATGAIGGRTLGVLGLLYAAQGIARAVVGMADAWTNANNRIKLFTESAAEQLKIQRDLFAIAQKTRVGYGVTSQLYQRLTIANDRLNLSQAETARLTETINKAFTVSGASTDEAANAIRQLTQAFNKGKLDGDEFRSVAENAGNVLGIIAKQAGVAKGDLQKMAEEGKITAELLASSFLEGADDIDTQFKRMDVSIESSFTILTNSLTRAVGQFDKATGASDALGRSIRFIGKTIDGVDWAAVGKAFDPRSNFFTKGLYRQGFDTDPGAFGTSGASLQSQGGAGPRDKTLENSAKAWADAANKRFADAKFGEQFFQDFSDSVRQTRDAGSGRFRAGLGDGGGARLPTLANLGLKLGAESEGYFFWWSNL